MPFCYDVNNGVAACQTTNCRRSVQRCCLSWFAGHSPPCQNLQRLIWLCFSRVFQPWKPLYELQMARCGKRIDHLWKFSLQNMIKNKKVKMQVYVGLAFFRFCCFSGNFWSINSFCLVIRADGVVGKAYYKI